MTLDVTVTDVSGRYLSGLTKEDFMLSDGVTPREITGFSSSAEPASVGVVFDISYSMSSGAWNRVENARRACVRFVGRASPQNEYFLLAFNKKVIELTDWTRDVTAIGEGLNKIGPKTRPTKGSSGTAIYDACAAALEKLAAAPHRKHVLLIFTDGGFDNESRVRFKTLKNRVRQSGALMYFLAMVERGNGAPDAQMQYSLDDIANVSGGRVFFPTDSVELNEIVDRVTVELNTQYAISFTPANAAKKGELNRLKIKVKSPPDFKGKLYVCAREGYVSAPE
jgi:Ca-activated chloride channel family protein